jgi:hypothetical protein
MTSRGYTRQMLGKWFKGDDRMIRAMEDQQKQVTESTTGLQTTAQTTDKLEQAAVIVLAGNEAFTNERVLNLGRGLSGDDRDGVLTIQTSDIVPLVTGGFSVALVAVGNSQVRLPLTGTLATVGNPETLERKTLDAPSITNIGNYANDGAAAAGGVPVGGIYRNGSVLNVRVT